MPNTFEHQEGRIKESNAHGTENRRSNGVEGIKKQPQKSISVLIAAPVVEMAKPDSASHGPIEFLKFLRKKTSIRRLHALAPVVA